MGLAMPPADAAAAGAAGVGRLASLGVDEELAVASGLDQQEHAVEREREHRERHGLEGGQRAVAGGAGEVRDDQRDGGERDDHRQEGGGALQVVALLVMAQAADQEPEADDAVQHDHQHREHRVAAERRRVLGREHHGGDQRDLDDDDGERQHQRAERLAEPVGQLLRLVHHAEGRPDDDGEQPCEQAGRRERLRQVAEPVLAEPREGENRRPGHRHPQGCRHDRGGLRCGRVGPGRGDARPCHGPYAVARPAAGSRTRSGAGAAA